MPRRRCATAFSPRKKELKNKRKTYNDGWNDDGLDNRWRSFDRAADRRNYQTAEKMTQHTRTVNTLKVGQVATEVGLGCETWHFIKQLRLWQKQKVSAANY